MDIEDMVDGHYDDDLHDDPLMAIVDKDLDEEEDANDELLKGDLSDSDMIDIVAEIDPMDPLSVIDQAMID
jgi:hypothetical protein|nr:MAG TPA: hypothetical protein [Caudoviricetes sp.]